MRTKNGLTIHRVERKLGDFHVELRRPTDDDTEVRIFATLSRDPEGRWVTKPDDIRSPSLVVAIDYVDQAYARERSIQEAKERSKQEARDKLNESVAPDWQAVVDHFGGGPDLADQG